MFRVKSLNGFFLILSVICYSTIFHYGLAASLNYLHFPQVMVLYKYHNPEKVESQLIPLFQDKCHLIALIY